MISVSKQLFSLAFSIVLCFNTTAFSQIINAGVDTVFFSDGSIEAGLIVPQLKFRNVNSEIGGRVMSISDERFVTRSGNYTNQKTSTSLPIVESRLSLNQRTISLKDIDSFYYSGNRYQVFWYLVDHYNFVNDTLTVLFNDRHVNQDRDLRKIQSMYDSNLSYENLYRIRETHLRYASLALDLIVSENIYASQLVDLLASRAARETILPELLILREESNLRRSDLVVYKQIINNQFQLTTNPTYILKDLDLISVSSETALYRNTANSRMALNGNQLVKAAPYVLSAGVGALIFTAINSIDPQKQNSRNISPDRKRSMLKNPITHVGFGLIGTSMILQYLGNKLINRSFSE